MGETKSWRSLCESVIRLGTVPPRTSDSLIFSKDSDHMS